MDLTAPLVPKWLPPSQEFWGYATGVFHIAAGVAILTGIWARRRVLQMARRYGAPSDSSFIRIPVANSASNGRPTNLRELASDTAGMIVALRPGCFVRIPGSVPQRRRVVVIGATEAGVSAAFHLGAFALLLEKRGACGPALFEDSEMRLGTRVTAIDVRERRLELSTSETIVYDKLISTLRTTNLQWLISDQLPTRVQSMEAWRYWLNGRDIELLDEDTQKYCGHIDGQAAGRRMAESLREALALKYTGKQLFHPRVVGAD